MLIICPQRYIFFYCMEVFLFIKIKLQQNVLYTTNCLFCKMNIVEKITEGNHLSELFFVENT